MILWANHYAKLSVRQLPLLWFVLTISPNLNPARSGWVLLIVYGLLYGAVSGFGVSFDFQDSARQKKRARLLGVWFIAAGLYCLAAIFSLVKINPLFFVLVALYGIIVLGLENFHHESSTIRIVGKGMLEGVLSIYFLYVGINNAYIENSWRLTVLIPGVILTTILIAIDLAKHHADSQPRTPVSLILFLLSIAGTIIYFNIYLSIDYVWPILFFIGILIVNILFQVWSGNHWQVTSRYRFVFWLYVLLLNGCFFYVFTEHTHILQLL